ncbi:hypothetical protein GCM10027346_23440 [Hymenobacter seoulensis]
MLVPSAAVVVAVSVSAVLFSEHEAIVKAAATERRSRVFFMMERNVRERGREKRVGKFRWPLYGGAAQRFSA